MLIVVVAAAAAAALPSDGCGAGIVADRNDPCFPKLTCFNCATEIHFDCGRPWHPETKSCKRAAVLERRNQRKALSREHRRYGRLGVRQ